MSQEGLGALFDLSIGFAPVDMQTGTNTGKRVSLKHASGVTIVLFKAAGTSGDNPVLTLQQHTASSSGTTASATIIDHYYLKSGTTLAGTEAWTKVTQTAAATISDPGAATTSGAQQQIVAIPVRGEQLSDGYKYVSLNIADTGTNAQLGCVLYILHGLRHARTPANLAVPLS
jgi:hypothetical protein